MAENIPQSNALFYYHLEDFEDVKSALLDLWSKKDMLLSEDKLSDRLFGYLEPLVVSLERYKAVNMMDLIDMQTISIIPSGLIKSYIETKQPELRDLLAYQISLVGAATMNIKDLNFSTYTFDEIRDLQSGNDNIYNHLVYAYTLRELIDLSEPDERVAAVFYDFNSMVGEQSGYEDFYWEEALIFSLSLQLVWKNFAYFGTVQQEFLLKNYFYLGIVAGVPMEKILSLFLGLEIEDADMSIANTSVQKSLEESKEMVPVKTNLLSSQKLSELLGQYISKVYSGDIRTLIQEKFLQDLYRGQLEEKKFSNWLRIAFKIYYSLRSKEYVKK